MVAEFMIGHRMRSLAHELAYNLPICNVRGADMSLVEAEPNRIDRVDVYALGKAGLIPQQPFQPDAQRVGERVGERGQEHTCIGMGAGQMSSPMQCDDGLASASRTRDSSRAVVVALDEVALIGMQEDGPFL